MDCPFFIAPSVFSNVYVQYLQCYNSYGNTVITNRENYERQYDDRDMFTSNPKILDTRLSLINILPGDFYHLDVQLVLSIKLSL